MKRAGNPHQAFRKEPSSGDRTIESAQSHTGIKELNQLNNKRGRKGDPRMDRAVAARLGNPELTPIEALRFGGFNYPKHIHDNRYILPNDTVTLGQHKNQLSRRYRLARQQAEKDLANLEGEFQAAHESQGMALPVRQDNIMQEINAQQQEMANIARQGMADFHLQCNPFFVHPALGVLRNAANQNLPASLLASEATIGDMDHRCAYPWQDASSLAQDVLGDALRQRGPLTGSTASPSFAADSPYLLEALNRHHHQLPSEVAVASHRNPPCSAVGPTFQQLAVALSSATNLTQIFANQIVPDRKLELALKMYRSDCNARYQRCMLLAGYGMEETQEASLAYKRFAFKAWSKEGKRMEQQIGNID